jgi:hypothetical protein
VLPRLSSRLGIVKREAVTLLRTLKAAAGRLVRRRVAASL